MTYSLGVDVGTSYTAAAICRIRPDGPPERIVLKLGQRSDAIPSVVFFAEDDRMLIGEVAERRGIERPERLVREFKRRIGDDVPIMAGDVVVLPEKIYAAFVKWAVDRAEEREGSAPASVAITHPAAWGGYKTALLRAALADEGLGDATLVSEPEAAALHYATQERVESGSTVAVYDLGGGTFDIALLRKNDSDSFHPIGRPEGLDRLGGADFDEAVLRHVMANAAGAADGLDPDDPSVVVALTRLRRECVEAKEALSFDTEASVPVLLPGVQRQVRIVRAEFERMIEDDLRDTVASVVHAAKTAGIEPDELSAILLIGGSSRIPLVAELLSAEFRRPIAIDADPKASIALGAAFAAASAVAAAPASQAAVQPTPAEAAADAEPAAVSTSTGRFGADRGATAAKLGHARRHPARYIGTAAAVVAGLFVVAGPAIPVGLGALMSDATIGGGARALGLGGDSPASADTGETQVEASLDGGGSTSADGDGGRGGGSDAAPDPVPPAAGQPAHESGGTPRTALDPAPDPRPTTKPTPNGTPTPSPTGTPTPTPTPPGNPTPAPDPTTPPADTPPADSPPADSPPADSPPADTPPADSPPADSPPADNPPADNPPASENPPAEPQPQEPATEQPGGTPTDPASGTAA